MSVMGLNIGYLVDPLNPASMDTLSDDQLIMSCVYATAKICRYGGHTSRFYSVLDHSWLIAQILNLVGSRMRLTAKQKRLLELRLLTHDLHEALILDLPRPLKTRMQEFKDAEAKIEDYVQSRILGDLVDSDMDSINRLVKQIDLDICTFIEIPFLNIGPFKYPFMDNKQHQTMAIQFLLANLAYTGLVDLSYEDFSNGMVEKVLNMIEIALSPEHSPRNQPEIVMHRIQDLREELEIV